MILEVFVGFGRVLVDLAWCFLRWIWVIFFVSFTWQFSKACKHTLGANKGGNQAGQPAKRAMLFRCKCGSLDTLQCGRFCGWTNLLGLAFLGDWRDCNHHLLLLDTGSVRLVFQLAVNPPQYLLASVNKHPTFVSNTSV